MTRLQHGGPWPTFRILAVGAALAASATLTPSAAVADLGPNCAASGFGTGGGGTVAGLDAFGGCQAGDKFVQILDYTSPPGVGQIDNVLIEVATQGGDIFSVILSGSSGAPYAGQYTLLYSVSIDQSLNDPDEAFRLAALDTDVNPLLADVQVQKQIYAEYSNQQLAGLIATLDSISGAPSSAVNLVDGNGKFVFDTIYVYEVFDVGGPNSGVLTSASNFYSQTPVQQAPAPGALGLLGLGLVGLLGARAQRRRRR